MLSASTQIKPLYSACALRGDRMYPPETNMRPLLSAWACNASPRAVVPKAPHHLPSSPPGSAVPWEATVPGQLPPAAPQTGLPLQEARGLGARRGSHQASDSHEQRNLQDSCPASREVGPVPACLRGLCALCEGVKPHQRRAGLASLDIRK